MCQAKEQLAQENITEPDIYGSPEVPLLGSCCSCFYRLESDRSLCEYFPPGQVMDLRFDICSELSAVNKLVPIMRYF